jgi:signal transduction histidine kinase
MAQRDDERERMLARVFPGASEMARRMRALDWSATALGPVDAWPSSLRTSVSTCLDCAFPIVLWWGPDLVILYNDEYRAMLGPAKHPAALGERGAVVWAEIWDVIAPMLSQVITNGEATRSRDLLLHIDRGYPEEAYFSFSYSPIHVDDGTAGGVFCPVIETTDKVIGERRLRTLRDLSAERQGVETEADVYEAAAAILADNPHDVPFAMIYRVDEESRVATLVAAAGIERGGPASPDIVALGDDASDRWSLTDAARSTAAVLICDLADRFADLPAGAWKTAPRSALVLPVLLPGQDRPRALLVTAVSPMRELDRDYRTFFGLVATQVAAALADAQALEEQRRRAEALAELDRAKTTFFSNISHELRTPLTLILNPIEDALASSAGLSANLVETLGVARRNSRRLLKLVNTLLEFSRIEAGRIEASFEPTDLAALTEELASVFRSAVEKAGLTFVVDCPPLPWPVFVDRDMWEKIVLNLLSNAFKFTFEGTITVALQAKGRSVRLTVSDTGVGIPETDLPRVFQRFERVRHTRARTHEGTGIGLALVQELARQHGGDVAIASREGQGTTLTVTISTGSAHLAPDRINAGRARGSTSIAAGVFVEEAEGWRPDQVPADVVDDVTGLALATRDAAGDEAPARILLADDNADMREYVRRLLSGTYTVEAVADGQSALDRVLADPPDLVLADVMMPRLDGFGLLSAIRANAKTTTLPVVLLSARAGEEAQIEGLKAGANAYLTKPFSARELLARVASQVELARVRRESEMHLREANRVKDEFLATLSHELRTPLNAILGWSHMLRAGTLNAETATRALESIERNARAQAQLVDDLLDTSRIVSGKLAIRSDMVDLGAVIAEALDTVRLAAEARDLRLTVAMDPDLRMLVVGDADRLRQVVWNLLSNAAKFTPAGGRVTVTLRQHDEMAEIVVEDNGQGIAADFLPHVFARFRQADSTLSRSQGGLGLGLALARHFVELHGGSIEAASPGRDLGATFTVRLPVRVAGRAPVSLARGEDHQLRLDEARVLVVDDDADVRDLMRTVLERRGARVAAAASAREALQAIGAGTFDVILADVSMPDADGYSLVESIRRLPAGLGGTTPTIAVTAYAGHKERDVALAVGFDSLLPKPVDPDHLVATVASVVRRDGRHANSSSTP